MSFHPCHVPPESTGVTPPNLSPLLSLSVLTARPLDPDGAAVHYPYPLEATSWRLFSGYWSRTCQSTVPTGQTLPSWLNFLARTFRNRAMYDDLTHPTADIRLH